MNESYCVVCEKVKEKKGKFCSDECYDKYWLEYTLDPFDSQNKCEICKRKKAQIRYNNQLICCLCHHKNLKKKREVRASGN